MRAFLGIALLSLSACASYRGGSAVPSTVPLVRSLQAAGIGTVRAQASTLKAGHTVEAASRAVNLLARTASPAQRPAIRAARAALAETRTQVGRTAAQLIAVSNSLAESDLKIAALQTDVNALAFERDAQQLKAARASSAYHRLKFWLAAAGAGLAFLAILKLVPPLVPYRWAVAGGAAVAAFGGLWALF